MKIACIILNYNDASSTLKLSKEVSAFRSIGHVVIVDNHSTDDSASRLTRSAGGNLHFIETDRNGGYGYGNNFGARYAFEKLGADAVLIANPDVQFDNQVVDAMRDVLLNFEQAGIVSAVQQDVQGREIEQSAWRIPKIGEYILSLGAILSKLLPGFYVAYENLHRAPCRQVDCVAGSLLLVSKQAFTATGGYDERVFLYCEETILGCKAREAGIKTYIRSDISYRHIHGLSISKSIQSTVKRKNIMLKSHHFLLKNYLKANKVQLGADWIMGRIALLEEVIKAGVFYCINRMHSL